MVQKLATDLQAALGANGEEFAGLLEDALDPANAANLPAFLATLPDLLAEQGEDLSTEGELILTKAGEDLQKCLPTPPTGGGTQTTAPTKSSGYYTPPAQQPAAFQYKNCDEARAHGAAPVYAGTYGYGSHLDSDSDGTGCEETAAPVAQPVAYSGDGGKLAYTGVATEPLVAWGAALLASGAWLILSGRRRA
ncbi:excalibur calcium-binding domain-containing protein [Blastococcus haudaquaticus]|uniref:excalibur calcium-binding domain-containing protein n=1 Tax=Blastococcus haudaquaticus TaxID=1938745 RepID=UPI00190ED5DE|nr:excalibur calcium-binding domain-containing protein [Blastococcus haudaquaticus]